MSPLRLVFLALAIVGAVWPMVYFVAWFQANGWSVSGLVAAWHANDATSGLVYDLTIAAVALTVWIVAESVERRDWLGLAAVPAIYLIGVSCGLPLYLWLRLRPR